MFSRWRKRYEWPLRLTVVAGWTGTAILGVGGTFFTGRSVTAVTEPTWAVVGGSAVAMVAAVFGIAGILLGGFRRWPRIWRLEWVAAGLAGAGVAYYVLVPWVYVFDGEMGRLQQAGGLLAYLVGFVLFRLIHCFAYDDELRQKRTAQAVAAAVIRDE